MALSLTSLNRVSGTGCNHFDAAYSIDGVSRTPRVDKHKIDGFMETADTGLPGNYKDIMMVLMIRYYLEKGYTLAQLPAKCQLPD